MEVIRAEIRNEIRFNIRIEIQLFRIVSPFVHFKH